MLASWLCGALSGWERVLKLGSAGFTGYHQIHYELLWFKVVLRAFLLYNSILHNSLWFTFENRRCSVFDYSRRYYFWGTRDSNYQPRQRKGQSSPFQMPSSMAPSLFQILQRLIFSTTRYSNSTILQNVKLLKGTRGTQHKITTFEKCFPVDLILESW